MRAILQIAAARLTENTSALLLAALSLIMSLSRPGCTVGLELYPGEDLSDTPEIISVEGTRGDEDHLVDKALDLWSDGMDAGEQKDGNAWCQEPHGQPNEEEAGDQATTEEGEEPAFGEWEAEEEHEEDEEVSATEAGGSEGINERVSADGDEDAGPTPPLRPRNAEFFVQEEIEKGDRSEHPVSSRISNDCLQVVPSPVLDPLNLEIPSP
jgi:hypothetical protein